MHDSQLHARASTPTPAAPVLAPDHLACPPPPAHECASRIERGATDLVDRILSGDSPAFLAATRQTGGE